MMNGFSAPLTASLEIPALMIGKLPRAPSAVLRVLGLLVAWEQCFKGYPNYHPTLMQLQFVMCVKLDCFHFRDMFTNAYIGLLDMTNAQASNTFPIDQSR